MNDPEDFFQHFHETPRPEFAGALYQRISRPVNTPTTQPTVRRVALTFAAVAALALVVVFSLPATRVSAVNLVRQIGAFFISSERDLGERTGGAPYEPQATAAPDLNADQIVQAHSVEAAEAAAGFAVLSPSALPQGYAQTGAFSVSPNAGGKNVVTAYLNPERAAFITLNQYLYDSGDAFYDRISEQETLTDVTVNGQAGVWITNRLMTHPIQPDADLIPTNWLIWEENGVAYTLMSNELSLEAALAFAESLK